MNRYLSMIPTVDECKKIIAEFKSKEIDVEATINETVKSDMISEDYYVSTNDGNPLIEYIDSEELNYSFGSKEYYTLIHELIKEDGIYIALCFSSEENWDDDEVVKYMIDDLNEDDIVPQGVSTYKNHVNLLLPYTNMFTGQDDDFGVFIDSHNQGFYLKTILGGHYGTMRLMCIDDYLEEPLYRLAIKLMFEAIIFKK